MAAATEVTALDVARELVATKLALLDFFENLTGTCPFLATDADTAVMAWAYDTPFGALEYDDRMGERSNEIARTVMRAVGAYITASAGDGKAGA